MTAVAGEAFTFSDLDRNLKERLLDSIDYKYRFRPQPEQTVDSIIDGEMGSLLESVLQFYSGVPGICFNIQKSDVVCAYNNAFVE